MGKALYVRINPPVHDPQRICECARIIRSRGQRARRPAGSHHPRTRIHAVQGGRTYGQVNMSGPQGWGHPPLSSYEGIEGCPYETGGQGRAG